MTENVDRFRPEPYPDNPDPISTSAAATDVSTASNYVVAGTSGEETSQAISTISSTKEAAESSMLLYGNVSGE